MGAKAKDPRNQNLQVQCLSCHRGHGTEHKKLLLSATQTELCTKCHEKYQR
jgi:predicted CXXCH cytochrome family protein